ncbi:tetratricopeptide repeat protein [Leptospira inadai serovar Lyme str. 10]|uniref:Tetratricopeptide repeat protein n=2 Tax=Leptospira inadai serovar Lyme TaxID=293084 RepID=V6HHX4_9LEPT|nr:tetratricopeptide repeat protein [Leptospira inadai]EQA36150.1 tetratricopeptide repeat protein [Leptospira inadai serovar Lyme str. 10]PNV74833.1 hypothetical protein BES34_011185 [Leptospira inadai serovar Lyme]
MKLASTIPILLLTTNAFFPLLGAPTDSGQKLLCRDVDSSGRSRSVWPLFFLSTALDTLNEARRLEGRERGERTLKALGEFEKYVRCSEAIGSPASAIARWNKAMAHYSIGQLKEALQEADLAEKNDPNFRETYILKASIFYEQAEYQKTSDYLEENLSRFPMDSYVYYLLSSSNIAIQNNAKSILYLTSLNDAIEKKEGNPKYKEFVYLSLGKIYFAQGQNSKAYFYLSSYLQQKPEAWEIRFLLAGVLNQLGKFAQAKKELLRILAQVKGNSSVEMMLGEMYFVESRSMSSAYFEELKKNGKLYKGSLLYGLYCVLTSRYEEAKKIIYPMREKYPRRLWVRLAVLEILKHQPDLKGEVYSKELVETAEIAVQSQLWNLSETLIQESIDIASKDGSPKSVLASRYNFLATVYEQSGSVYRAIVAIRKSIELSGTPDEIRKYRLHLAFLLRGNPPGKTKEAEQITKEIIKEDPKNSYAHYLLGVIFSQTENFSGSQDAFEEAIQLDPKTAIYYFYRAISLEKLGKIQEMELDLRKSMDLDPENPIAYNYLGYYLSESGSRLDEAFSLIRKAVELAPDNEAYQDSLGWIYYKRGMLDDALLHLNLAYQILQERNESDPTICEHLGDLHFERGELGETRMYWEKSSKLFQKKEDKARIREKLEKLRTKPVMIKP